MRDNGSMPLEQRRLTSLCPLLVHDSVPTLAAADGVASLDLVFVVTVATDVDHGLLRRLFGLRIGGLHGEREEATGAGGRWREEARG